MKVSKIAGLVGAGLLAVSCHDGTKIPAKQKALNLAGKYLTGTELIETQKQAQRFLVLDGSPYEMDKMMYYWDSILCINKEKEGYAIGQKMIKDSAEGKYYSKPIIADIPSKPDISSISIDEAEFYGSDKVSKYYTGEELLALQKKAPIIYRNPYWTGYRGNEATAYYGEQAAKGAFRKGFNDGVNAAREALKDTVETVN